MTIAEEFIYDLETGKTVDANEGESYIISANFTPESGAFVKANILTITATLLDVDTNTVINSREDQNVLDINGGYLADDGSYQLTFTPTDTTLLSSTKLQETRLCILTWTWEDLNGDTQTGIHKLRFYVVNTEASDEAVITPETEGLDLTGIKRVKTKHIEIETHDPRHVQTARDKENMTLPNFCCLTFCKGTPK